MADSLRAQAVWFSAPRTVELRAEPVPPPGPGQVRVQTIASALSHGTERLVYRGEVSPNLPLDLPTLAGSFGFPIKYGYAAVGRVRDVGPDVTTHAPGDLVFALHPHQTIFNLPAASALRLPTGIDPLLGVFTANLETAVNIVHDTPLIFGETALIFGQGIVGLLVAQVLRLAGARRVVAVEPASLRRDLALRVGVDLALAPAADLRDQVRAANAGRAPDVVIEVSGAGAALQAAIDNVVADGAVVVASWYGTKPVQLMLGEHFHRGRVRLISSQVGRLNPALGARWDYARRAATVLDLLPKLVLADLITHRIPLADAATAYRLLDEQPDQIGQIVLTYSGE
ncbi:MAG: zinc-binding alcohol dehydrogenase [Chloroflexi bacterium]|nr:zinc-binding alcohol dehydrogenase [Chloroflexota bacterium]